LLCSAENDNTIRFSDLKNFSGDPFGYGNELLTERARRLAAQLCERGFATSRRQYVDACALFISAKGGDGTSGGVVVGGVIDITADDEGMAEANYFSSQCGCGLEKSGPVNEVRRYAIGFPPASEHCDPH
jgi:hypothetical protein